MIYFFNIFVLGLLSFLTLSFLPHLRILGVAPLLPVFFIVLLSYFRKGFEPILLAAFCGIIFDLFSSYPFGFYLVYFLFVAVLIRYLFQEGMKILSFWYYVVLMLGALGGYYITQAVFLYRDGIRLTSTAIGPVFWGMIVNLVCAILVYVFGDWYFDATKRLADVLKKR